MVGAERGAGVRIFYKTKTRRRWIARVGRRANSGTSCGFGPGLLGPRGEIVDGDSPDPGGRAPGEGD